ncbi:hypothetical protein [Maricaulis sp.]|uniref:alginate O-acetyltransferase AlgX-related protein n=1 Tax=Maricaulis sp. TaxID=1486257 RepID=UPI0025C0E6B9|nr:hypothetical protein [Maricaulis sp.]
MSDDTHTGPRADSDTPNRSKLTLVLACLTLVCFGAQLLAPFLTYMVVGAPRPYEGRNFDAYPRSGQLLDNDSEAREQFAGAFEDRLLLRKLSIGLKNWLSFRLFGVVDTPQLVSGTDGFFYLKRSLEPFDCDTEEEIVNRLASFELYMAIAANSGEDLLVTMSPNKASVTPDALRGRVGVYAQCYGRLSRFAAQEMERRDYGQFINHQPSIEALIRETGEGYFRTDTHWQHHIQLAVMTDLYSHARPGGAPVFSTAHIEAGDPARTDLASNLGWDHGEPTLEVSTEDWSRIAAEAGPIEGRTIIFHDSFYGGMSRRWPEFFEDAEAVDLSRLSATRYLASTASRDLFTTLEAADRILINLVERALLGQMSVADLSLSRTVGYHFVQANLRLGEQACQPGSGELLPIEVETTGLRELGDGRYQQNTYPTITIEPLSAPTTERICVSVRMTTRNAAETRISLPRGNDDFNRHNRFHVLPLAETGSELVEFSLILPSAYSSGRMKIEPFVESGADLTIERIEVRAIP